jgi:hypothetical protein
VVRGHAHTLAGSARGIGAWKVAEAAEAIERFDAPSDASDFATRLGRLGSAVNEARAAIAELLRVR